MLEAKASGIMSLEGEILALLAMARMMGRRSATVPVLETKAATKEVTPITRKKSLVSLVPAMRRSLRETVLASPV